LHQQTTPRQVINNFRSCHMTAVLLAASVARTTKTLMWTTGRIIIACHKTSNVLHTLVHYQQKRLQGMSTAIPDDSRLSSVFVQYIPN